VGEREEREREMCVWEFWESWCTVVNKCAWRYIPYWWKLTVCHVTRSDSSEHTVPVPNTSFRSVTHSLDGLWCGWFATCNGSKPAPPSPPQLWPLFNVMKFVLSSRYGTSWNDKVSIISILDESITVILWYKVSCVYEICGWPESRTLYNACKSLPKVRLFTSEATVRVARWSLQTSYRRCLGRLTSPSFQVELRAVQCRRPCWNLRHTQKQRDSYSNAQTRFVVE